MPPAVERDACHVSFVEETFGDFYDGCISIDVRGEHKPTEPAIQTMIERTWDEVLARAQRSNAVVFNGPLVRYLRHTSNGAGLHIEAERTDYATYLGTNQYNAERGAKTGWRDFADPLGASAVIVTSDGYLVCGKRSDKVASHPGFVHTFGGGVEPSSGGRINPFDEIRRELCEELGLVESDIDSLVCRGLLRDATTRQPELVYDCHAHLTLTQLSDRFSAVADHAEHISLSVCRDNGWSLSEFLRTARPIAPVAFGALCFHGRRWFGEDWYTTNRCLDHTHCLARRCAPEGGAHD